MEPAMMLRLVAEDTRHRLLRTLRGGELAVGQIVAAIAGEQSNVSHHLAILRDAGLVEVRRAGRQQLYRISDPAVSALLDELDAVAKRLDQAAYALRLGLPASGQFHGYG